MSDLSQSDTDNVFFCSFDDSDLEKEPGTSGEESKALAADTRIAAGALNMDMMAVMSWSRQTRAAMHTHTSWQNDNFALTDNKNIPT